MRAAFFLIALLGAGTAQAANIGQGRRCLDANDVPCAVEVAQALGAADSRDPDLVAFAAETAFYDGRFSEAHDLLSRAAELGWEDRWDEVALYERTVEVTRD
jgi:hypothetical protein